MKNIEFRAWNIKEKWMDLVWLIDFEHELLCFSSHNQDDLNNYELMQYTGLKDKNGVKIFEGDIIGWIFNDSENNKYKEAQAVIFEDGCFDCQDHNRPSFCERNIVGNIYENPELLK